MTAEKLKNADDSQIITPFFGDHDHSLCKIVAVETALNLCKRKGLKLTKIRQQVLELIWEHHQPVGAYDILQKLQERGYKPAPPTAYRALEFLRSAQLIHRIESLNAYVGCPSSGTNHQCQFYICTSCGHIAEANNSDVAKALSSGAQALGFVSQQPVIEVHGLCQACQ
jgi:Fur family zinc uptake transcriptional regulator